MTAPGTGSSRLEYLDVGFQGKFVEITLKGEGRFVVRGEVVGVYNERPFMWHPKDRDTLALARIDEPEQGLESFSNEMRGTGNAIFTLNTDQMEKITVVERPKEARVRL